MEPERHGKRDEHVSAAAGAAPPAADATAPRVRRRSGLEWPEDNSIAPGRHPGDRYVRLARYQPDERPHPPAIAITARDPALPKTGAGRLFRRLKHLLIGRPLATAEEPHERVNTFTGLAVFASDNISSSAYATEEIMRVLVLAGIGALALTLPITLAIAAVLAIVVTSYQQTIRAYPTGGGSYIVASDNLGTLPGLTAAAALLIDYVLTVAVSIAAGVAALTSIFPTLFEHRVALGAAFVAVLCLGNLRGIRESGAIFTAPTYVYLIAMVGLLGYGLWLVATGTLPPYEAPAAWREAHGAEALGLLLILRAFASGSVALTGTEAVSNGVPAFKAPEARHAQTVLILMGSCFATIFLGISFLAGQLGVLPDPSEQETVISQITRTLVGEGSPYHYLVQLSTALLLVLAANTAFADFPRLASILARDRFLPRVFQFRGDRLAFTGGIVLLAVVAGALIVVFQGSVTNLIPLYTVGVFVAFTLSQGGMVRHWWRLRNEELHWRWRAVINAAGAVTTGIVAIEVAISKFQLGAWMVIVLIPLLILGFTAIHQHYQQAARELATETPLDPAEIRHTIVVPIAALNRVALQTLAYACSIEPDVTAVHVSADPAEIASLREAWWQQCAATPFLREVQLVVVESPYRTLIGPLLSYIDEIDAHDPTDTLTIILPEFVPAHWWEHLLHNQSALRLKAALLFRPGTVVTNVPYHLARATK